MKRYSTEFKENIVARMFPPNASTVPELARETGVPKDTLYGWRLAAQQGSKADGVPSSASGKLDGEGKLSVVIETAGLNEQELGEYCRRKGVYPEQVRAWGESYVQAGGPHRPPAERELARKQSRTIRALQSELRRKDRALAETAALLVLQKKAREIRGEPEDAKSSLRSDER
jgi:transposase-like protein